ncbi:hypothetical protein C0J52_13518 [Blattella germanica]|nr:hypothetical protein C0J52_13518 [Blattella germanica]
MKNPVRPAPLPPNSNRIHRSTSSLDDWGDFNNDPFPKHTLTNRPLSVQLGQPPGEKKKPPPRPPPPKFSQKNQRKQVPNRPSNLLSGLFNRNASRTNSTNPTLVNQQRNVPKKEIQTAVPTASLIDLHSPSCSPTPTTRSSSDGLSVNSFGSDGSMSNNGQTPGGGSSSLFESGFEDDFDFFGGLSSSSSFGTPLNDQKDPWSVSQPQDPFSPPRPQQSCPTAKGSVQKQTSNSTFFTQTTIVKSTSMTSMPTIIRAKPGRPPTLPRLSEATSDQNSGISLFPVAASRPSLINQSISSSQSVSCFASKKEVDDDVDNWSPPMPSIPPPPLPPEALLELESEGPPPVLPPRPVQFQEGELQQPYGIALYDFPATHPDDLSFKANDKILLLHQVNSDWMYGQKGENQGMFPINFIKVVVPLNETKANVSLQKQRSPTQMVKALYSFSAETWDDLEFQEGATIYVTSKINDDWLFGECDGRRGQFPSSFVDRIPSNLPQRTN